MMGKTAGGLIITGAVFTVYTDVYDIRRKTNNYVSSVIHFHVKEVFYSF